MDQRGVRSIIYLLSPVTPMSPTQRDLLLTDGAGAEESQFQVASPADSTQHQLGVLQL